MALISLDHVKKIYPRGRRPALDDVTLHISRGEFVFLVGASGSGKTSLLRLMTHEEQATEGEIRVAGHDLRRIKDRQVPQYRRSIGTIFQDYKLLENKTVEQNVAFALEVIGTSRATIKSLVPKVLETVGLTGKEENFPSELSGGEQQRVTIARAYVNHPQILLADEPTGNLDPTTSLGIMEVLDAINRTGTTIVMATHNEEIVNSMRKRVVELHGGQIVRDEEHGSYDSKLYFPDAHTQAQAHEAISSLGVQDSRAVDVHERREETGEREHIAVQDSSQRLQEAAKMVETVSEVTMANNYGDEGIARLARAVHTGKTGRYGDAFVPLEHTLTWGQGMPASEHADANTAEEHEKHQEQKEQKAHQENAQTEQTATRSAQPAESARETAVPAPPMPPAPKGKDAAKPASKAESKPASGKPPVPAPPMPPAPAQQSHTQEEDQ